MKESRDRGYAMLAAIIGIAAFSYIAFEAIAESRGVVSEIQAEYERAKLNTACNAGLMLVISSLASVDRKQQWPIDGTTRNVTFDGVGLAVTVEDERGKFPLNGTNEDQVRQLFMAAGVSGTRLSTLVDSYEDWIDPDKDRRLNGAEAAEYQALGYQPRNSSFHTVSEVRLLKGMDDDLYSRVAPAMTVFFGESGGFSETTAQVLALEALSEIGPNSPEIIERQRELAGDAPAANVIKNPPNLLGRTLTVRVEARRAGAYLKRSAIIELTNNKANPYWLRYLE
jgi:general secretion pathway protein K